MSKLIDWIKEMSDGEEVEAVVIGEMGWNDYNEKNGKGCKEVIGKIMTLNEALPYISYESDNGYGVPECNAMVAYTKTWVISVAQYDGATFPFRIARNPLEGFIPEMPGG